MKNNHKGFSLIELIIVIAIMAILVAIIAPNLTKYLSQSKEKADVSNIDEIKKVLEQACALTNTEVDGFNSANLNKWIEIKEDSYLYDSDAPDVGGYMAIGKYVAEVLGDVPKSKVTKGHFEAKITYDNTSSIYKVEVRTK